MCVYVCALINFFLFGCIKRCHIYTQDVLYRRKLRTPSGKLVERHVCPRDVCPGLATCGYRRGHAAELQAERKRISEEKKVRQEMANRRAREDKDRQRKLNKINKEEKAKKKEEAKKKHLFDRCQKFSTFMNHLKVDERYNIFIDTHCLYVMYTRT